MASGNEPTDLMRWARVYHAALTHGDADAAAQALEMIQHFNHAANRQDQMDLSAAEDARSPLQQAADVPLAAAVGALQGGTFGLAGALSPTFKRAVRGASDAQPVAEKVGDVAGTFLVPTGAIEAAGLKGANALRLANPVARSSAAGALTGATVGGIRGAADADTGHRMEGLQRGAILGALLGGGIPLVVKGPVAAGRAIARRIDRGYSGPATAPATEAPVPMIEGSRWEPNITVPPTVNRPIHPEVVGMKGRPARPPVYDEHGPIIEPSITAPNTTPMNLETPGYQQAVAKAQQAQAKATASPVPNTRPKIGQMTPGGGRYVQGAPTQKAAGGIRAETAPSSPVNALQGLEDSYLLAKMLGQSDEQIAERALRLGLTPDALRKVVGGKGVTPEQVTQSLGGRSAGRSLP